MKVTSCGTVLYTVKDNQILYLLLKARDDGYCGFPKGHMESGETEHETALRETWEETSVNAEIVGDFRAETGQSDKNNPNQFGLFLSLYTMKNGKERHFVYFLARFFDQTPKHNPGFESRDFLLLPLAEAQKELTYDNTKKILRDAEEYIRSNNLI